MAQTILITAIIVLAFWLLPKMFPARKKPVLDAAHSNGHSALHNGSYAAVTIHCYRDACTAAGQVAGIRFLSDEAPLIPLESCTAEECHCVYMHHSDRRGGTNRRTKAGLGTAFVSNPGHEERRASIGRRPGDLAVA